MQGEKLLDAIIELSPTIRYVALHGAGGGEPLIREHPRATATATESERWDELIVNPVLIELASRRGEIDLGGLDHLLVRYRRAYNLVLPLAGGHLSIVLDPDADPLPLVSPIRETAMKYGAVPRREPVT